MGSINISLISCRFISINRFSFLAIVLLIGLGGCAELPPLNFSVPNVGPAPVKIDAEVRSITVTLARPDEKIGRMPAGIEQITPMWQTAIIEALNRFVIFRDDAKKKVSLSVKIIKLNVPLLGIEFTTEASARYEIIDRENGDIIFSQNIESIGTTPMGFAFLGIVRQRESINRAIQNNIARFLQSLETVDINKPMFPAS